MPGWPPSPSSAETAPSCIWPPSASVISSSCSVSLRPVTVEYWSARRSIAARSTGRPSSENPAAPRRRQLGHVDQLAALLAAGDGGEEPGRHGGLLAGPLDQTAEQRRRVDHRRGVGHRQDGDEPAGRRGPGAGRDVLLVLVAGRAQMDVRVDQAGRHGQPGGVDLLHPAAVDRVADLGDPAVGDAHVELRALEAGAPVDQPGAADHQVGGRRVPPEQPLHQATS